MIKWKHFPRYWPFVTGIHRSPLNSLPKGQWRGALTLSLICTWTKVWENHRDAGDLRRHRAHYEVTVMWKIMMKMYVDICICDWLHVQESLPRRHESLSFRESAAILIRNTGTVYAFNGQLARYINLWVAHAPGMPGTFSPPPLVRYPGMHHVTCATHVPWCIPGSLISGLSWSRWREKHSWHSQRMRNPQFCVTGKRPITVVLIFSFLVTISQCDT